MKRLAKPLTSLGIIAVTVAVATAGWAYWTTLGAGTGAASVGTLNPPTNVTVPDGPVAGAVAVSWTPPSTGVSPTAYEVQRSTDIDRPAETRTWQQACGGWIDAPATSCSDDVADGTYLYRVTARYASWTAVSPQVSPAVTVSTVVEPTMLVLAGSDAVLVSGNTRHFTATIQDDAGNTVTSGTHTVTFAQSGVSGSVTGLGAVQSANGVATITVTGHLAGPVTLLATANFGAAPVTSPSIAFDVTAGPAAGLTFKVERSGTQLTVTCTGPIGTASYSCETAGTPNGSSVQVAVSFADIVGNPTVYSPQNQLVGYSWASQGSNKGSGQVTVNGGQHTSATFTATKTGSNVANVTVSFSNWQAKLTVK